MDSVSYYTLESSPQGREASGSDNGDLTGTITPEAAPPAGTDPSLGWDFLPVNGVPTGGLYLRLTANLTSGLQLAFNVVKVVGSTAISSTLNWSKAQLGTASNSTAHIYGVAAAADGSVYAVGDFAGSVDLGAGQVSSLAGALDMFIVKYNSSGVVQWVKTFGSNADDTMFAVAVDSSGNPIVTGGFHQSITFGGTTLTASGTLYDGFVVKFDPTGTVLWAKKFGGTFDDIGAAIVLDASDNIFVAARFQSQPGNFGGTNLTASGSSGGFDIALMKMANSNGATTWAVRYGGTSDDIPTGIAISPAGDYLYVCGQFWGTTDLGGGSVTSSGGSDMFVGKYSASNGAFVWVKTMGGANNDNMNSVAVDPTTGNVLVTGGYVGTINFGGGNVASGSAGSATTMFLACYNASGTFLWVKTYGGDIPGSGDSGRAMVIDSSGKLALTGYFTSWMDFNRDGYQDTDGSGYFLYVIQLNGNNPPANAGYLWSSRATTNGIGNAVCYDALGHVVTGGSWQAGTFKIVNTHNSVTTTVGAALGTAGFAAQYVA